MKEHQSELPSLPPEVKNIFDIFSNQIRLVGGCVRDWLRQKPLHDYDFATPLTPEKIIRVLEENHIPFFTAGLKHGTVTAVYHNEPYEITTLRTDIRTDGRHSSVQFIDSYQTDALRRDFTMNALFMDKNGVISDYVGGQADIQNKYIRFIGQPDKRVQEDYLRILRYFRFLADFGIQKIHQPSLEACCKHKHGIKHLSVERIRSEMMRLLMYDHVIPTLRLMHEKEILSCVFPTYDIDKLESFLKIYPQATILERLVLLVPDIMQLTWKWSRVQKKQFKKLLLPIPISTDMHQNRYALWQLGPADFAFHIAKAELTHQISHQTAQQAQNLTMPFFPVTGNDIAQLGFQHIEISKQLKLAETLWVKMSFPIEKKLVINSLLRYNERRF